MHEYDTCTMANGDPSGRRVTAEYSASTPQSLAYYSWPTLNLTRNSLHLRVFDSRNSLGITRHWLAYYSAVALDSLVRCK